MLKRIVIFLSAALACLCFAGCGNDEDEVVQISDTASDSAVSSIPDDSSEAVTISSPVEVTEPTSDVTLPAEEETTAETEKTSPPTSGEQSSPAQTEPPATTPAPTTKVTSAPVQTTSQTSNTTTTPAATTSATTTATSTQTSTVKKQSQYEQELEAEILEILNEIRAENGLCTFEQDKGWEIFADRYTKYMVDENVFGHSGIGKEIVQIGGSSDSAEDIINRFMNSPGHKRNILDQAGVSTKYCAVSVYYSTLDDRLSISIILEDRSYEEMFTVGMATYAEEYFRTGGDVSDEWILETQDMSPEEEIAHGYYKPEYNKYYPHLAQYTQ